MNDILKNIQWKGPPFSVTIQKNENDGKYVYTDAQSKFILKLEDMTKNDEGSENEKTVLDMLLKSPKDNLPRPLNFARVGDMNVSIMVNNGVSLDGKIFQDYFKMQPSSSNFIAATKSLVNAVRNLHEMGFIHRDITPGNVVYNTKIDSWTLIDFDFAVPFDYDKMGSEVIVNPKYDYIVHPWFKLDEDDYMYFDVDRLKRYMGKKDVMWYMLIDYYAVSKVLLYNFGLLLSEDNTYYYVTKDDNALDLMLMARFGERNKKLKEYVSVIMKLVASFSETAKKDLPHATESWNELLKLVGLKKTKKRLRNDADDIISNRGKLRRTRGGVKTFDLIK